MFRQLTIRDRVILQYQLEHQSNCSCASISQSLNCHPASVYRELKRNGIQLPCKAKIFPHTTIPICKKLLGFRLYVIAVFISQPVRFNESRTMPMKPIARLVIDSNHCVPIHKCQRNSFRNWTERLANVCALINPCIIL
jgi:hypothetical protein